MAKQETDQVIAVPVPEKKEVEKRQFPVKRHSKKFSSFGLSEKMLPPVTRRRSAIYEMLNLKKVDPRITEGPRIVEIPPFQLSPVYEIYDRFEEDWARSRKVMPYSNKINVHEYYNTVDSLKNRDAGPQLDMPEFINGQVRVDCEEEYSRYVWWELHPLNASNKFRDKTKNPLFKRIDTEFTSPYMQLMKMDLAFDAEKYVISCDAEKLYNLAVHFSIPRSTPIQDMRIELRRLARENPQRVMFSSPEKHASTMENVIRATALGIIDYKPETREFFFNEKESFFQVPMDQAEVESVAKYLVSKEGAKHKETLEASLSFWE